MKCRRGAPTDLLTCSPSHFHPCRPTPTAWLQRAHMLGLQAHPLSRDCALHWPAAEREEERSIPLCLESCDRLDPTSRGHGPMTVTNELSNPWRLEQGTGPEARGTLKGVSPHRCWEGWCECPFLGFLFRLCHTACGTLVP